MKKDLDNNSTQRLGVVDMMREVPMNLMMIFLAGVANFVIGMAWYSPLLFAKPWMKAMGHTADSLKNAQKDMPKTLAISFVAGLLMAFVLQHSSVFAGEYFGMQGAALGLMTAFWSWLGFIAPVQLTGWLFEKKPFRLFLINTGYQLVAMLAMGIILTM